MTGVPVQLSGDSTGTSLGASLLLGGGLAETAEAQTVPPLSDPRLADYAAAWAAELQRRPLR